MKFVKVKRFKDHVMKEFSTIKEKEAEKYLWEEIPKFWEVKKGKFYAEKERIRRERLAFLEEKGENKELKTILEIIDDPGKIFSHLKENL